MFEHNSAKDLLRSCNHLTITGQKSLSIESWYLQQSVDKRCTILTPILFDTACPYTYWVSFPIFCFPNTQSDKLGHRKARYPVATLRKKPIHEQIIWIIVSKKRMDPHYLELSYHLQISYQQPLGSSNIFMTNDYKTQIWHRTFYQATDKSFQHPKLISDCDINSEVSNKANK